MGIYLATYYTLIILSIAISFVAVYNGHKRYLTLLMVLSFTQLVEMYAHVALSRGHSFAWMYHLFVPVEYCLLALYLRLAIKIEKIKKIIIVTIPLFVILSLLISWRFYQFSDFPGINISTEGFFLFIFCATLLFNLEVVEDRTIFLDPDVWIALGILIFEGGTFFYNCVYTKLLAMDPGKALQLFEVINKPLNLCLYIFINIGLVCLLKRKRYIME